MNKLIFGDIDGVLNGRNTKDTVIGSDGRKYDGIEPDMMNRLKRIIDATDANIIVSSTWRLHEEFMDHLEKKLGKYNTRIKGQTPTCYRNFGSYSERWEEIKRWFDENTHPDNYIILDDIDYRMKENFGDHYFQTDVNIWLTDEIADKCIEFLNKETK